MRIFSKPEVSVAFMTVFTTLTGELERTVSSKERCWSFPEPPETAIGVDWRVDVSISKIPMSDVPAIAKLNPPPVIVLPLRKNLQMEDCEKSNAGCAAKFKLRRATVPVMEAMSILSPVGAVGMPKSTDNAAVFHDCVRTSKEPSTGFAVVESKVAASRTPLPSLFEEAHEKNAHDTTTLLMSMVDPSSI